MKKIKHLLLLVVCFGLFMQVNASPIDRAVAKKAAIAYCQHKTSFYKQSISISSVINENTLYFDGQPTMYVFNMDEGFVITTTDDRAPAIIAYSPKGNFDVDNIPDVVSLWLGPMQSYVAEVRTTNPKADTHPQWVELRSNNIAKNTSKGVAPLLTTNWGQSVGYNDSCPVSSTGPGGRCVTGCVATAMAQIMNYHKYPTTGNGSNSYSHMYYGNISESFNGVEYKWDSMTTTANSSSRAYISQIMYHAGFSVNMNYGPNASGTQASYAVSALQNNFRYRPDIRSISRLDYTILNWMRVMKENIDAHQPVLYSGTNDSTGTTSGHAWVCDGYNDSNYFHMNWGWDSYANGYYYLDTLIAMNGSQFLGRYRASQKAVVNIAPFGQKFCYETRVYNEPNVTITDGSGLSDYKNESDCRVLVDLDTMEVHLTFNSINTEKDHDFVKVYYGDAAIADSLVGTFSGDTIPATIVATGGKLYIVFTSDNVVQGEGWSATVEGVWQGVEDYSNQNSVKLYPNPVNDNLWITIPEISNANATVAIADVTGRVVYQANAQFSAAGNTYVNTGALSAGVYIVKVISPNQTAFSSKLIKR